MAAGMNYAHTICSVMVLLRKCQVHVFVFICALTDEAFKNVSAISTQVLEMGTHSRNNACGKCNVLFVVDQYLL